MLLAHHYLTSARYPEAVAQYEKLLQGQPDNPVLLNNLAWLYDQAGDARAVDFAKRAYELVPESAMVMDTYGWILHRRGDTAKALELISEAARLAPQFGEIRYHHAVLLHEAGDDAGAAAEARAVLAEPTAVQHHADAQALLERIGQGKE